MITLYGHSYPGTPYYSTSGTHIKFIGTGTRTIIDNGGGVSISIHGLGVNGFITLIGVGNSSTTLPSILMFIGVHTLSGAFFHCRTGVSTIFVLQGFGRYKGHFTLFGQRRIRGVRTLTHSKKNKGFMYLFTRGFTHIYRGRRGVIQKTTRRHFYRVLFATTRTRGTSSTTVLDFVNIGHRTLRVTRINRNRCKFLGKSGIFVIGQTSGKTCFHSTIIIGFVGCFLQFKFSGVGGSTFIYRGVLMVYGFFFGLYRFIYCFFGFGPYGLTRLRICGYYYLQVVGTRFFRGNGLYFTFTTLTKSSYNCGFVGGVGYLTRTIRGVHSYLYLFWVVLYTTYSGFFSRFGVILGRLLRVRGFQRTIRGHGRGGTRNCLRLDRFMGVVRGGLHVYISFGKGFGIRTFSIYRVLGTQGTFGTFVFGRVNGTYGGHHLTRLMKGLNCSSFRVVTFFLRCFNTHTRVGFTTTHYMNILGSLYTRGGTYYQRVKSFGTLRRVGQVTVQIVCRMVGTLGGLFRVIKQGVHYRTSYGAQKTICRRVEGSYKRGKKFFWTIIVI